MINNIAINSQHWANENCFLPLIFMTPAPIEYLIVKDMIELYVYNKTDLIPLRLVCTLATKKSLDVSIL